MEQRFEAVILAGGKGTRLLPLTEHMPKPLLPVMGVPVIERLYRTLERNGYTSAAVTVCHLAEQVTATGKGSKLQIGFFKEQAPLGSAGSVRAIADRLCDTVTVLCGDAVVDIDLSKALSEHKKHGGVTLILTRTDSPFEYGTVLMSEGGRIKGILEKPSLSDTFTDLISTGIYILDRSVIEKLPKGEPADFATDLFPMLLKNRVPLYGCVADGIWNDIGNIRDYYACNMRISEGRSVIDATAEVSPNASVSRSVIMQGAKIGESTVTGAIICRNAVIGDGCVIPEGCVVGEGTELQNGTLLQKGLLLEGGIVVRKGSVLHSDRCFGEPVSKMFDDDGICVAQSCASAVRLGRALSVLGSPAKIGVMSAVQGDSIAECIAMGCAEAGADVTVLQPSYMPTARFAAEKYSLDCLAYCLPHERIFLLGKGGIRLSSAAMKKVMHAYNTPPHICGDGSITRKDASDEYISHLCACSARLDGVLLPLTEKNATCLPLIAAAERLGASVAVRSYGYTLSEDGGTASFVDEDGGVLSYWQAVLLAASGEKSVCLPRDTPVSVERFLRAQGITVGIYNDCDSETRRNAFASSFVHDAALLVLMTESRLLSSGMTASEARSRLPEIHVVTRFLEGDGNNCASRMDELSREFGDMTRGVRINYRGGSVAVYPGAGGGFKIFAEAVSSEIASELCDLTEKRLK